MSKRKSIVILTLLAIVVLIYGFMSFVSFEIPGTIKDYNSIFSTIGKGIDLSGGYYVVLEPEDSKGASGSEILEKAQEIIRICNRAIVMYHGKMQGELTAEEMTEEIIMRLATGGHK